jgi:hypothetical protein
VRRLALSQVTDPTAGPHPKRMGRREEYAALEQAIAENDYLSAEVNRLDGALRFPPK